MLVGLGAALRGEAGRLVERRSRPGSAVDHHRRGRRRSPRRSASAARGCGAGAVLLARSAGRGSPGRPRSGRPAWRACRRRRSCPVRAQRATVVKLASGRLRLNQRSRRMPSSSSVTVNWRTSWLIARPCSDGRPPCRAEPVAPYRHAEEGLDPGEGPSRARCPSVTPLRQEGGPRIKSGVTKEGLEAGPHDDVVVGVGADHEMVGADLLEAVAGVEAAGAVVVDEHRQDRAAPPRAARASPITQSISAAAMPAPCQGFST